MKRLASLLATALIATSAQAQVFTDNFDSENGGNTSLNYNAFANWTVTGNVDLVKAGDYGLTCGSPTGACIDLDGTTGPGAMRLNQVFTLGVGDVMRFSFDVSGNQRTGGFDDIRLDFFSSNPVTAAWTASLGGSFSGTDVLGTGIFAGVPIAGNAPWSTYYFEFTSLTAGTIEFGLSTTSADNIGPMVDNVSIDYRSANVVPEPSTYALMATGLALLGGVARRKRVTA